MSDKDKQTARTFPGQHEDETVKLVFHQHPIVMRVRLIICLVILMLAAVPLAIFPISNWPWWVLLAGLIVSLLVFGHRFISWYFSIFIITNERLVQVIQKGFFNRRVIDISHSKMQSVNYEIKGVQATMFGYGTIIVQTYVGDLVLPYIYKPEKVHQLMVKQMRNVKALTPDALGEAAVESSQDG
ncbi:PH domain-containing protein [Candidatus Microgenomates bacterium]|nr:PH domain-containing protein [Candidatus Microgenomates bacterium]